MTANWTSGVRWNYPKGHGDVEPMNAQAKHTTTVSCCKQCGQVITTTNGITLHRCPEVPRRKEDGGMR